MLEECMTLLSLKDDGIYFDGTLGGAGHSCEILKRTKNARLIATDLDEEAIAAAGKRLAAFGDRAVIVHDNFKNFKAITDSMGIEKIDGALLDLGVSSRQLDAEERGFSYMTEGARLDMRMDKSAPLSAYEVVNSYDEKKLREIIRDYGEERFFGNIARNIVAARQKKAIETTGELVAVIDRSIPARFKRDGHPARRTFQAIRIEVNGELSGLAEVLYDIAEKLKKGGRLAVISFHSLEDRIVKRVFTDLATGCTCDRSIPVCICGRTQKAEILTKKPVTAGEAERISNKRSQSAKLRVIEKL